jgi:hypothetical protein
MIIFFTPKNTKQIVKESLVGILHHTPSKSKEGENINPTFGMKPPGEYWSCGRWCNTCCGNGGDCSNRKNI